MKVRTSVLKRGLCSLAILGCVATVGCGAKDDNGSGAAPGGASEKPVKVAFVLPSARSDFWISVKSGAEEQARKMGVELSVLAGTDDLNPAEGVAKVQDAIVQQPDGLVVTPNFPDEYAPVVTKAVSQGIKVGLANGDLQAVEGITTAAYTNEANGGRLAGQYLLKALPQGGEIGVLHCFQGNPTMDTRVNAMQSAITGSKLRVVTTLDAKCDGQKARAAVADMLTSHPKLAGIFSNTDANTTGALELLSKRKELVVVSYDAQPEGVKALIDGTIDAEIAQFPTRMGSESVRAVVEAVRGKKVPRVIDTGVALVTKENAEEFAR
jgi:ABC-type sugar transport system substrate-binding protein